MFLLIYLRIEGSTHTFTPVVCVRMCFCECERVFVFLESILTDIFANCISACPCSSFLTRETSQEGFPRKSRHPLGLVLLLHPDSYSVDAGEWPLGAETHTVCWLPPSEVETLAKGANIFSVAQPQRSRFESSLVLCHDWSGPPGPIQFFFFHRSSRPGHLQVQVASGNCHAEAHLLNPLSLAPGRCSSTDVRLSRWCR